jgi:hypothetical protein
MQIVTMEIQGVLTKQNYPCHPERSRRECDGAVEGSMYFVADPPQLYQGLSAVC